MGDSFEITEPSTQPNRVPLEFEIKFKCYVSMSSVPSQNIYGTKSSWRQPPTLGKLLSDQSHMAKEILPPNHKKMQFCRSILVIKPELNLQNLQSME